MHKNPITKSDGKQCMNRKLSAQWAIFSVNNSWKIQNITPFWTWNDLCWNNQFELCLNCKLKFQNQSPYLAMIGFLEINQKQNKFSLKVHLPIWFFISDFSKQYTKGFNYYTLFVISKREIALRALPDILRLLPFNLPL